MNSVQESKQELQAAIRYAENAISSANATIESMEFRQEMAKKQHFKQTGREQALEAEVKALKEANMSLVCDNDDLKDELFKLRKEKEASSGPCGCQAYRDLEEKVGDLESEVNALEQPESGACGCQGCRDLLDEAARLKSDNLRLKASVDAASEHIKDMREDMNDQIKLDEEVRQGINDFLDFLDTIGYERA